MAEWQNTSIDAVLKLHLGWPMNDETTASIKALLKQYANLDAEVEFDNTGIIYVTAYHRVPKFSIAYHSECVTLMTDYTKPKEPAHG